MTEIVNLKIKRISDEFSDVQLPAYATDGSAGMDIRAAIDDPVIIQPGKIQLIPTNLQIEIPEGYEIQIRPRSGLAINNGISILNTPGTIDSDYRGEIKLILINLSNNPFTVKRGDKIAQMVVNKYFRAEIKVVDQLSESERSSNGFGHSGI